MAIDCAICSGVDSSIALADRHVGDISVRIFRPWVAFMYLLGMRPRLFSGFSDFAPNRDLAAPSRELDPRRS